MKRMIDNKEFNELKKDIKDVSDVVEAHTTDFVINQVVYDSEAQKVEGFVIKDVENEVTYNVELGGGKTLYQHNIRYNNNNVGRCTFTIINDNPNEMDTADIGAYLYNKGLVDSNNMINASGYGKNSSTGTWSLIIYGIYATNATSFNIHYCNDSSTNFFNISSSSDVKDKVIEL